MNRWQELDEHGEHTCEWCGTRFNRKSHYGKTPRYCRASHRVRASERRRGLLRPRQRPERTSLPTAQYRHLLATDPTNAATIDELENQYDQGYLTASSYWAHRRGITTHLDYHLLRPGAPPDETGRIPTLCGVAAQVTGKPVLGLRDTSTCHTCQRLAPLHPPEPHWWKTTTLLTAATLADDLRSTILTIGQAIAGHRNPITVLQRTEHELKHMNNKLGRPKPLPPSLHPTSTRS
jgi:hypothetical protein